VKPLERIGSIKLKLGLLIVAAVATTAAMSQIGFRLGWPIWLRPIVAGCVSLLMVRVLSRGMTSPLRQMASAAQAMARGDKVAPIETRSRDEVGELARAFNSMADDLEALEAERRALVANAAHELRTPIAGLQATLENVRDGIVPPTAEVIDRLSGQAERLGHIVSELLDLSRLEAVDHPIRSDEVALGDVIPPAVATAVDDRPDVAPTIELGADLVVLGDPSLLGRLVTNLVRNAVIHGDAHSIRVDAQRTPGHVTISVSDLGPGLSLSEPNRVFDRFVRGETSRSEDRPGTGLGLAISQAIAQRHGGRIDVRNLSPTGCCFTVTLPAAA
jgi:signal transduction histidine kinase